MQLTFSHSWLSSNRLRLNPLKTQFIWLGTRQQLAKLDLNFLATEFPLISFSTSGRDFGDILDQELTFSKHLSSPPCLAPAFTIFVNLGLFLALFQPLLLLLLSMSFVCSRLDYCSSLYTGLPQVRLSSLERVFRSAARLVGSIPRCGSVSSYMHHTLHWLPLRQRILYRLCSLVWQSVLGSAPRYLCTIFTLFFSLRVAQPSVPLLGVTSSFHMPALLLCSAEHSLLLVQQRGMSCHLSFGYLLAFTRLPSTPN